jgi:hypothetical protein
MRKLFLAFIIIGLAFILQPENIFANQSLMIAPGTVTINNDNREATVTFSWTGAGGQIVITESDLPAGVGAFWSANNELCVVGIRPHHTVTEPITGTFKVKFALREASAELTVNVNLTPLDPPEPNFVRVNHINFAAMAGHVGTPFDFGEIVTLSPLRGEGGFPTVDDMKLEVVNVHSSRGEISASVDGLLLKVEGEGQGTVRVRITIPEGRGTQDDFVQEVNISFSSKEITASLIGLENLFSGVEVDGRIIFELTRGTGIFAKEIFPQDFFVRGLPWGLRAEPAERINDTTVTIKIVGAPSFSTAEKWTLSVPTFIPARNLWQAYVPAAVLLSSAAGFEIYPAIASASISPNNFTFDLNQNGWAHRNFSFHLNDRDGGFSFMNIRYGLVTLREGEDFSRGEFNENIFTINREFFARLPVGQWELTFVMSRGESPKITMNIIDSSVTSTPPEFFIPAPPPAPPSAPPTPDENFIFLTGGKAVDTSSLRWDLNRARVSPEVHDGTAQVTVRSHVLDHLSWIAQGQSFEILTPATRVKIPNDFLNVIIGGRAAITSRGLRYDEVDIRISVIDRSDDSQLKHMFGAVYPNGELLSPIIEFLVEFVHDEKIFFTAHEFSRPINLIFNVMDNACARRDFRLSARGWNLFRTARPRPTKSQQARFSRE